MKEGHYIILIVGYVLFMMNQRCGWDVRPSEEIVWIVVSIN